MNFPTNSSRYNSPSGCCPSSTKYSAADSVDCCSCCCDASPSDPKSPPTPQLAFAASVRQQNEQLKALRSENFKLKLRIYLLEQQNDGDHRQQPPPAVGGDDCAIIMLRTELQDKQELICEAAIALEQMDEQLLSERNRAAELHASLVRTELELAGQKGEMVAVAAQTHELQIAVEAQTKCINRLRSVLDVKAREQHKLRTLNAELRERLKQRTPASQCASADDDVDDHRMPYPSDLGRPSIIMFPSPIGARALHQRPAALVLSSVHVHPMTDGRLLTTVNPLRKRTTPANGGAVLSESATSGSALSTPRSGWGLGGLRSFFERWIN